MDQDTVLHPTLVSLAPLQLVISKMTRQMNFLGILEIIIGTLISLTVVGAAIGVPAILSGIRLKESAGSLMNAVVNNDVAMLSTAFESQGSFFRLQTIMRILTLVLGGLYLLFLIGVAILAAINREM